MFKLKLRGTRLQFIAANTKKLAELYPNLTRISLRFDKIQQRHILNLKTNGKYVVKQFAKIKMELFHGVVLGRDDTVDHIDQNKSNDYYSNLVILPRKLHVRLDAKRVKLPENVECIWCHKMFKPTRNHNRKDRAGPFCSRSCTGKYGASVQSGKLLLKRKQFEVMYYTNKQL